MIKCRARTQHLLKNHHATLKIKTMSSSAVDTPPILPEQLASFTNHLKESKRILALCGAGLSAASGLPTFRGAGGYWRNYIATDVATPGAFYKNPAFVWQFYNFRRHMALKVKPNAAHHALAELTRKMPDTLTITQNVDGLSPRAGHPKDRLELLHGSLFDLKCSHRGCDYTETDNYQDPIVPALEVPVDPSTGEDLDISRADVILRDVPREQLPQCPKCQKGLLRPGVVWFGESLPSDTLDRVGIWVEHSDPIDLMLVIGTSAQVYPAAGYIDAVRAGGTRIAVINTERPEVGASELRSRDWFFQGDASIILPQILKSVIGQVDIPKETTL